MLPHRYKTLEGSQEASEDDIILFGGNYTFLTRLIFYLKQKV